MLNLCQLDGRGSIIDFDCAFKTKKKCILDEEDMERLLFFL